MPSHSDMKCKYYNVRGTHLFGEFDINYYTKWKTFICISNDFSLLGKSYHYVWADCKTNECNDLLKHVRRHERIDFHIKFIVLYLVKCCYLMHKANLHYLFIICKRLKRSVFIKHYILIKFVSTVFKLLKRRLQNSSAELIITKL